MATKPHKETWIEVLDFVGEMLCEFSADAYDKAPEQPARYLLNVLGPTIREKVGLARTLFDVEDFNVKFDLSNNAPDTYLRGVAVVHIRTSFFKQNQSYIDCFVLENGEAFWKMFGGRQVKCERGWATKNVQSGEIVIGVLI